MLSMDDDSHFSGPVELPGDDQRHKSPKFKKRRPFLETAKKPFIILIALVLAAGLGFGVWKFISTRKHTSPAASQTAQSAQQAPAVPVSDIPDAKNSETYHSDSLNLEFQYPKAWKVTESEGGVRVVSPDFSYQTVSSGEKAGNFRIYIRKGARDIDGKYIGRGAAIKPSEKLVYSNPGLGQRKDTLLSSFGIDTPDNFAFFLIAGNFQLNKGDTLGPNYGREPDTIIIGGGYSSTDLTDDLATNTVAIDMLANNKAYAQAVEIVKSIKL